MINFKNNLKNIFLNLIFIVSASFNNSNVFAEQKRKFDKVATTCQMLEHKLTCDNFEINNNLKVKLLNSPDRIILNFEKRIIFSNKNISKNRLIKSVKLNKKNNAGTGLDLELKEPVIITSIDYNEINSNHLINLQIHFSKTTVTNFAVAKYILNKNGGNIYSFAKEINVSNIQQSLEPSLIKVPKKKSQKFKNNISKEKYIVFIDPGHGGRDPGAVGELGTLEKNVTLKTSILLSNALKKYKNINPILSRKKDIYLSLKERTNLAKKYDADIFISLHADSSINKKANGISVFSLSDRASDAEAKMLAKRENEVDNFWGNKNKIRDPIIYDTLIKMFQREAMNDSSYLAKKILSNLEKTKLALNRGHRFAGFKVLKSYDIPSVLIEIGFLSNKKEEKKLLNTMYLNELSNGLAVAIGSYLDSYKK